MSFIIVVAVLLERMKLMPMPERASKGHVEQVWSLVPPVECLVVSSPC